MPDISRQNSPPLNALRPAFSVAASLFLLWSLYLLIRFAIAFHKAAGQLKHQWTRDDRAAATEQTTPQES